MPTGQAHFDIALALLCSLGGLAGYSRKKSMPSLIGGVGIGSLYGASAYMIQQVDAQRGHQLGAFTSMVLGVVMGVRLVRTGKFMPAGLLASTGAFGLWYHVRKMQEWA